MYYTSECALAWSTHHMESNMLSWGPPIKQGGLKYSCPWLLVVPPTNDESITDVNNVFFAIGAHCFLDWEASCNPLCLSANNILLQVACINCKHQEIYIKTWDGTYTDTVWQVRQSCSNCTHYGADRDTGLCISVYTWQQLQIEKKQMLIGRFNFYWIFLIINRETHSLKRT